MGVQGLWTLLSPAGRKLRVEALEGQRLAIDVSIWVIRMIYGFSGEHNSQFKNVHLIGIFKRLIRLLSAGIKPVFVFDGKPPELKRHTLYLRQLQREKRSVNLQKLAENYVIRQLEGKLRSGQTIQNNQPEEDQDDLESLNSEEMNEFEKNLSDYQTKIVETEFQQLVKQQRNHPGLFKGIIESVSEFYTFDIPSKIAVVKEANQRLLDIKNNDLSKISDLEQFSIQQAKNYVQYVINKREVQLVKEAGQNEILGKQEDFLLKEASSGIADQLKHKLVTDNDTKLITGVVNADKDKMFLFISKNKKIEEEEEQKNLQSSGKQNEGQGSKSKSAAVTSKIGILSKPIRKTRAEKNKEIQERLSHLLKQRENEFLQMKKTEIAKIASKDGQIGKINEQIKGRVVRNQEDDEDSLCLSEENEQGDSEENQKKQVQKKNNYESDSDLNFDDDEDDEEMEEDVEEQRSQNNQVREGKNEVIINENYQEQQQNNKNIERQSQSEEDIEDSNKSEEQSQMSTAGISIDAGNSFKKIQEFVNANKRDSYEMLRSKVQNDGNSSQSQQGFNNEVNQDKEILVMKKEKEEQRDLDIEMNLDQQMENKRNSKNLNEEKEVNDSKSQKDQTQPVQGKHTNVQEIQKEDKDNTGELMTQLENIGKRGDQGRNVVESDKIKKEKEDFQKLLQQLKSEEEKANMTPEEIEMQNKIKKNERLNTLKKQNQDNNINVNSQKEKKQEVVEEEEEEEDDVEDIKAMLAKMDKWEEDQNKAGEEGVELNDEELAHEFQRFINLNEMDSESIQTKFQQVRQLLLLFGVPWIESPSEAEAQCAKLEQLGLVDGVITDDSDVFLFGATKVYRGLFGKESDYVRYFDGKQIANDIGISRDKLIHMALFLGSDYTLGIKGVGIVNSMEIVTAFESTDGLRRFKQWASKADVLLEDISSHYRGISLKEKNYKDQHKNYKKHWEIPPDFPSERVINAYLSPNTDNSTEPFHWGQANIQLLQTYCEQVFGWSQELAMYFLKPLQIRLTKQLDPQKKITDFYQQAQKFAVVNSNRLKSAIRDLKKEEGHETEEQLQEIKRVEKVLLGITKPHINAQDKKKKTTRKTAIDVQEEEDEEQNETEGTQNNEKNAGEFEEVDKQFQKLENSDFRGFKYKPGQKGSWGNKRRNFKKDIF